MTSDNIEALKRHLQDEVARLAAVIKPEEYEIVSFQAVDGARPFIHVTSDGELQLVAVERGELLECLIAADPDELLYWSFKSTASSMGSSWAARNPVVKQEFRFTMWARTFELLRQLKPEWARRWQSELLNEISILDEEAKVFLASLDC